MFKKHLSSVYQHPTLQVSDLEAFADLKVGDVVTCLRRVLVESGARRATGLAPHLGVEKNVRNGFAMLRASVKLTNAAKWQCLTYRSQVPRQLHHGCTTLNPHPGS